MEALPPDKLLTVPQIAAVEVRPHAILVAFEDGKELLCPAELLYALIPEELTLAAQIKSLLS